MSRRKGRIYPRPVKHLNDQGKPDTSNSRGKRPHKGGYHGKLKGINPFKIYFEVSLGTTSGSGYDSVTTSSDWNPGKRK